jgi:hypothetical protein
LCKRCRRPLCKSGWRVALFAAKWGACLAPFHAPGPSWLMSWRTGQPCR